MVVSIVTKSHEERRKEAPRDHGTIRKEARIAAVIEFIDMSLKAEGYAAGQVWVR
jgi:hypothetical protein